MSHTTSPLRIHVKTLTLSHFRNYHSAQITLGDLPVVLTGPNGAGKTNILEAVSLLTPGGGLRRASLSDMDTLGDNASWAVVAEVQGPQGDVQIGTGRMGDADDKTDKRVVKIDGKIVRGHSELARVFAALWLTPQMDNLFIEGGTARRKFLDRLVYSFDSQHVSRVNAYDYAMRERNRLLQMGRADAAWLDALEHKMAEQGVAITVARAHTVEALNRAMVMGGHHFPKAHIALKGLLEQALMQGTALTAEEAFKEALATGRAQDGASGRTQSGAHRTQVEVLHVEKQMLAERCSTGEQKALLVSIVLAQARAGATWHGRIPVLLLDEVASHLDEERRSELFSELADIGAQCWLTGTDVALFEGFKAQLLAVDSGVIKA